MTLLAFQGFEGYSTTQDQEDAGDVTFSGGPWDYQTGRLGGKCIRYTGFPTDQPFTPAGFSSISPDYNAVLGLAVKFSNVAISGDKNVAKLGGHIAGGWDCITFNLDGNYSSQFRFNCTRYSNYVTGATFEVIANTWYYVEMKCRVHNTSGVWQVRVNEQLILDYSGDTYGGFGGNFTGNCSFNAGAYTTPQFDDLYWLSSEGTDHNDFLGDIRIDAIHPNGAGNYSQLTPSAGNNYECVDETEMDDSDYVYSAVANQKDSYAYQDVPTDLDDAAIYAIQIRNNAKRTAAATNRKIDPFIRKSSVDYSQTEKDLPDNFGIANGDIIIKDPSDSSDWTQAKINACEFGVEVK